MSRVYGIRWSQCCCGSRRESHDRQWRREWCMMISTLTIEQAAGEAVIWYGVVCTSWYGWVQQTGSPLYHHHHRYHYSHLTPHKPQHAIDPQHHHQSHPIQNNPLSSVSSHRTFSLHLPSIAGHAGQHSVPVRGAMSLGLIIITAD